MELFSLEHKKLWRKLSTKISVILCFTYVVIFGSIVSYQYTDLGSFDHEKGYGYNFDGYEIIRKGQEYSKEFGGKLTDESLQQMVSSYQQIAASGMIEESDKTDWQIINSWLTTLYPELQSPEIYQTLISYVDSNQLTDFYGRRQNAIERFLESNEQKGAEKEYLLQINSKVEKPFRYEWAKGWSAILSDIVADIGVAMALFLSIVLSSLFAGEWHDNISTLVLTTKNGWKKIALAKIFTGMAFTAELFVLLTIGNVISQIFFLGTSGWDMPIQTIKLISIAPMSMLQAELYEYAFAFLGAIGFAGVVMFISSKTKSNVLALLFSLAVVYGPKMIVEYLPYSLQKALDLLPLVGSATDIFRTNTFNIFGKYVWSPYLLIIVPFIIGVVCLPFAVKNWSRRQKV